jgi:hypothetical protein
MRVTTFILAGKEVSDDLPLLIGDRGRVLDCRVTLANL